MRIFLLVIALVFCFQGDVFSADSSISVPAQAKVEQQGDLSLAVIIKLFGNTADFLIGSGNANVDGAEGFFSGLIVSILGVLNFAAMIYVSSMIVYMWATFSVTTAHQGEKLGSGIYNSLWLPVRHGLSFALVVPVVNGLSIMQVGILLCIGIGINFANAVWNFSGDYLVRNINIHVESSVYSAEKENAYKLLPIMFKNAVVQDVIYDKLIHDKEEEIWEKNYSAYDPSAKNTVGENNGYDPLNREGLAYQEYPINYDGQIDENGRILRVDDYLNGRIILRPRDLSYVRFNLWDELTDSDTKSNPGLVQIQMPKWSASSLVGYENLSWGWGKVTESKKYSMEKEVFANQSDALTLRKSYVFTGNKDNAEYTRQKAFSEQKTSRVLALWKKVNDAAEVYLHSDASANGACAVAPCKFDKEYAGEYLGKEIASAVSTYSKGIAEDVAKAVQDYSTKNEKGATKIQEMIAAAIDSKDGKSRFGWMSAGFFPFALAFVQESINSTANNVVAGYNGTITDSIEQFRQELKNKLGKEKGTLNRNYLAGIEKASDFYDINIGRSTNFNAKYLSKTENTKAFLNLNDLKDSIISTFAQKDLHESYGGVLGWTLDEIGKKDPILVLYNFGTRLSDAAMVLVKSGLFVSVATLFTSWALVLSCLSLLIVGGFFVYVVPMIPVIYWIKALISWLFMCVESMVAAPFWVCAHALPEGSGFAGNHARRGYMMLLDIVARPVLLVIGAVFAIILAQLAGVFIYKMFNILFSSALNIESLSIFPDVVYSILVMSMVYYVFYMVFTRGVNYMPEHVINWCGGQPGGLRDEDEGTSNILRAGGATQQLQEMTRRITPGISPNLAKPLMGGGK